MSEKEYLKRDVVKQEEQTWCRISNKGELEYLDWLFIEKQAAQFDLAGESGVRDNTMTMCKLMVAVRQQTLQRACQLLTRYADYNNDAAAVIMYDPVRAMLPPPPVFVFFHVGEDVTHPTRLVDSIQKTNPSARIIMCTDSDTPAINGVERRELPVDRERLMVERWRAYAELGLEHPAVYLDTDMIVRGVINLPALLGDRNYVFCNRSFDRMVPFNGQQRELDFSEHDQRPIGVVYPLLGCFIITRSAEQWRVMCERYAAQPDKYQRWYGDQEVLREMLNTLKAQEFNLVEESLFACLPEHADKHSPLIVHYKGNRKNATV